MGANNSMAEQLLISVCDTNPHKCKPSQRWESNAVKKRLELQELFLLHLMELSKPPFWAVNVKWRLHSDDDSQITNQPKGKKWIWKKSMTFYGKTQK